VTALDPRPDLTTSRYRSQSIDFICLKITIVCDVSQCVDRRHRMSTERRESQPYCTVSHASTTVVFSHCNDKLNACVMFDRVSEDRQTEPMCCVCCGSTCTDMLHCMPAVRNYTIWCPTNRQRVARHFRVSQHCHFSAANKRREVISPPVLKFSIGPVCLVSLPVLRSDQDLCILSASCFRCSKPQRLRTNAALSSSRLNITRVCVCQ